MSDLPDAMPRWVLRAAITTCSVIVAVIVAFWAIQRLQGLLVTLLLSLVLAFALEPAVNRLETVGFRRGIGTLLTLVGLTAALGIFVVVMGRLILDQVALFIEAIPNYITDIEEWYNTTFPGGRRLDAQELLDRFGEGGEWQNLATSFAPDVIGVGTRVIGILFQTLTVLLFTFYLVSDGPRLRRSICSMLPPDRQREVLRIWELGIEKTGAYLSSRAVLAVISTFAHWAAFTLLDVPFPLLLAIWVGVLSQFIPVIGTYLAGILPILIALVNAPISAVWVIVVIVVYQQIENYLLAPRVTSQTMEIHAAVAFGSVLVGSALLGPIGALLALPISAILQSFASTYIRRHEVVHSVLTTKRPSTHSGGDDPHLP